MTSPRRPGNNAVTPVIAKRHGIDMRTRHRAVMRAILPLLVVVGLLPQTPSRPPDGWVFSVGRDDERLAGPRDPPVDGVAVSLPHRFPKANTVFWYRATRDWPAGKVLEVDADDGAQVLVDGQLLERDRRWFFRPANVVPGPVHIVVRVFNNAMAGGLRRAELVDPPPRALAVAAPPSGFVRFGSSEFRRRMPAPGSPCRFTAWADSQDGGDRFSRVVRGLASVPSDFSVAAGDLVGDGSDPARWRDWFDRLAPLWQQVAVVPVPGNHDYDGFYNDLLPEAFTNLFGHRWAAWTCGVVRVVAVDLNAEFPIGISRETPQHEWLERETTSREWQSAAWRVLVVHQPPWSRSWPGYDGDEASRIIVSRLAARGLDLVISGHSHAYEHLVREVAGRRVHLVITGGAGGTLEDAAAQPSSYGEDRVALAHHFVAVHATDRSLSIAATTAEGQPLDAFALGR